MIFKSNVMNLNFKDTVGYLTFKELEKYDFMCHAFATRLGGVSKNEFKSMNFSFSCGDDPNCVMENYGIFGSALNFDINKLVRINQKHGISIKKVSKSDIEGKNFQENIFDNYDGLITDEKGIVLQTSHADCPAIFMLDPVKKVVGIAHAGWRGTAAKIAKELANSFVLYYNSAISNIICALGPGISKCCFEFSKSDLGKFESLNLKNFYVQSKNDTTKVYVDLLEVNKQILIKSGILEKNIIVSDFCTKCNKDVLFSHRATAGKRGNNVAFISLI